MIRRIIEYLKSDGVVVLVIVVLLAVLLSVTGCTKEVYVPVETVRTEVHADTLRLATAHRDSIYVRDSIYIDGETIVKERWRERYVYRTDTLYKARVDTAYQFREVTKLIERELTWWQRARLRSFGWLVAALAVAAAWILRRPLRLIFKKIVK